MKKLATSLVLLAAATFGLSATATQLTAVGKSRNCQNHLLGQQHIMGNVAREEATKFAEKYAEDNLKRECDKEKGTLELGRKFQTSCGPFDGSMKGLFEGRVCVTCESTVTGDCAVR